MLFDELSPIISLETHGLTRCVMWLCHVEGVGFSDRDGVSRSFHMTQIEEEPVSDRANA